jgi:cobalt/nickel transport system permease protein
MIEEPFAKGSSLIHGTDPRIRMVFALLFSVLIAITHKFPVAGCGLLFAVILCIIARLTVKPLLSRMYVANIFIVFLWLVLPFSMPGRSVFEVLGLTATYEGIQYTLLITVKCNAIILLNIALLSTSSISDLVHAMRHFRMPDKLIHIFFFLYRYANVMVGEYAVLQRTLKVRGFKPSTSVHTYRTYGAVIGTLLVRGHDRSEKIHKAMVCRGFRGKYWLLDHFVMKPEDYLAACLLIAALIFLGVLQWTTIIT